MHTAPFEYHRAGSVDEALSLLGQYGEGAKLIAGGHSLVPVLMLRFAQPSHLVDIRRIQGLAGIRENGGSLIVRAQWLLGIVSPSVRQSSSTVWSNVPGRTAALKSATVRSSATGSRSSLTASSPIEPASIAGKIDGMNSRIDRESMIE